MWYAHGDAAGTHDEHGVPALQQLRAHERVVRRQRHTRQGRRLLVRQVLRHLQQRLRGEHLVLRQHAVHEPAVARHRHACIDRAMNMRGRGSRHDTVAQLELGRVDLRAEGDDFAGTVGGGDEVGFDRGGVVAREDDKVAVLDGHGVDLD